MTILSLLGTLLKDDTVIELLDDHEIDVVYDFDRLHENTTDCYWASIHAAGVQLRFNEHQVLDVAFCYITPRDGFSPVAPESIGVPIYPSFAAAEQSCQDAGSDYVVSTPPGQWLKVIGRDCDVHYEFFDSQLALVTLMLNVREA